VINRTCLVAAIAVALGLSSPVFAHSPNDTLKTPAQTAEAAVANPFLVVSDLPFQYPRFDLIRNEHYGPALDRGMQEQLAEVDTIANAESEPSFDNTILALERSGQLLERVGAVFSNLSSAHTNPEIEKLQSEFAPRFAAHGDAIALNDKLFARVSALYAKRAELKLDAESLRLLERYHEDFVRAGARLDAKQKARLTTLNSEIASLETTFSQNLLKATNAGGVLVDTREELKGLPEGAISAAAEAAAARNLEGKFLLTLQNTSGQPALALLENRALREKLYRASTERASSGEFDNRPIIAKLARLRAERSAILGYPNHAAYVLADQTARTTDAVNKLTRDLAGPAVANAKREAEEMQKLVDAEGGGFKLAPWDWAYYAEKVRRNTYAFDADQLRPYFELDSVLDNGVFFAASKLYGLSFKEIKSLPTYHPDVRVYEVADANGKPLAIFVADFFARDSKRGGAWMNEYVSQAGMLGTSPVVGNHLNIPKPKAGEPALLTFDEVTTLFHEFGHALHGMFSDVRYPRFSGTNVPTDFVEYPSQVNEMWATWPEVLRNYAKHYKTGEPIPQQLLDKVIAAEKFNQGFATTEYLAAALLDQAWHQIKPEQVSDDVLAFEAAALTSAGVNYSLVPPRYRSTYFAHTFAGGYSAGYYSYLWSEVLDADSVEWFKENGGLTRKNGDHFRETLLSRGGSTDAMELFRTFRGREPAVEPLLERRGLNAGTPATH
jgi:peptidyl-dipeptidase Dcp